MGIQNVYSHVWSTKKSNKKYIVKGMSFTIVRNAYSIWELKNDHFFILLNQRLPKNPKYASDKGFDC